MDQLELVERLREKTGCSYSAAAAQCGFNSIRTFNNAFKRVTGKTPSDYFDSAN